MANNASVDSTTRARILVRDSKKFAIPTSGLRRCANKGDFLVHETRFSYLSLSLSVLAATDELAINNAKQLAALSAGDLLAPGNYIERERGSMQPRFPFVHTPDASGARNNPKLYTA
jgi:hypothetical protein